LATPSSISVPRKTIRSGTAAGEVDVERPLAHLRVRSMDRRDRGTAMDHQTASGPLTGGRTSSRALDYVVDFRSRGPLSALNQRFPGKAVRAATSFQPGWPVWAGRSGLIIVAPVGSSCPGRIFYDVRRVPRRKPGPRPWCSAPGRAAGETSCPGCRRMSRKTGPLLPRQAQFGERAGASLGIRASLCTDSPGRRWTEPARASGL